MINNYFELGFEHIYCKKSIIKFNEKQIITLIVNKYAKFNNFIKLPLMIQIKEAKAIN